MMKINNITFNIFNMFLLAIKYYVRSSSIRLDKNNMAMKKYENGPIEDIKGDLDFALGISVKSSYSKFVNLYTKNCNLKLYGFVIQNSQFKEVIGMFYKVNFKDHNRLSKYYIR
ncbi:hypothetical protein SLOPH_1157 [Spraguea lophii 42_110]|uniref:Uncharacterized protein n=1 Tax=Spraguea lophii (strain 42_110) TaxID=1358809 RepID=S7XHA3_SPRLO|nr:hypothetical protein SLOPH_1157 [Spraguea lophii 42_110]